MRRILFCILVVALAMTTSAYADKRLLNLDSDGVALQGYDPVGYFTESKPVEGDARIIAKHDGAVYRFASEGNRQTFMSDPDKYAPQFGGYCAYGVSRDALAPINVDAFQVIDGKLYVQKNRDILKRFNEDPEGNLRKAQANWPGLLEKHGR